MKKFFKILAKSIAATVVLLVVLRLTPWWDDVLTPGDYQPVAFETLVLTAKPNQYLVCPPSLCAQAEAHRQSPVFGRSVAEVRAAVEAIAGESEDITTVAANAHSIDLVARTPIVRWSDWVTIRFIDLADGKSTVAVYSRSVYGRKDFGANEARVSG